MAAIVKTMLINLVLIIAVSVILYYLKDKINHFVQRRIRHTSRRLASMNNNRYKRKMRKKENKKIS